MANLIDIVDDYYPPASGINVPLKSSITITFDRLMDEARLQEDFFLEGPDADQYIGPGLLELRDPAHLVDDDIDNFLTSPGYQGIVDGKFIFETISGVTNKTKLVFTPSRPLAAIYDYTAHLLETLDDDGNIYEGHITWPFQTGTGSIEVLPTSTSTSVLARAIESTQLETLADIISDTLQVVSTIPEDHSVQNSTDLSEIIIEFNKSLDPTISPDAIQIETIPATDHPNVSITALGELAKTIEIKDKKLIVKL